MAQLLSARLREAELESENRQISLAAERDQALSDSERLEAELETVQKEHTNTEQRAAQLQSSLDTLQARYDTERAAYEEKLALLGKAQTALEDRFKSLAADSLKTNNQSFLDLAKATLEKFQAGARDDLEKRQTSIEHLVKPLRDTLGKVETNLQDIEKQRSSAFTTLGEQISGLQRAQFSLSQETSNLSRALRTPQVRGRWGELQLRRTVEIAGMLNRCDFQEQVTQNDAENKSLRPDLIVHLPNGRQIVVDAKAPLSAYLDSLSADDETERTSLLARHARHVRDHLKQLGSKNYQEQFKPGPEFVVLFLPGETFFSAALEQEPDLIEFGVDQKVILATPTTLIALLKAVAYGWQQEETAKEAEKIRELGQEIHKRLKTMGKHFNDVSRHLERAVGSQNKAMASLDSRVMVTARKLSEMESLPVDNLDEPTQIEQIPHTTTLEDSQDSEDNS